MFVPIWERIRCVASQALNSHEAIDTLPSQVFRVDGMNRDTIVGYGSVLIPTQTGRYEKAVHVYAPQPSSMIQRFRSWITGAYPEVGISCVNHRTTRIVHLPRRTLRLAHSVPQALASLDGPSPTCLDTLLSLFSVFRFKVCDPWRRERSNSGETIGRGQGISRHHDKR